MKSELLRSRYMSFGVRQSMLLVAFIHVASLGADQLSLGTTRPPRSEIVLLTASCTSRHVAATSSSSSVSSPAKKTPLSSDHATSCSSSSEGRMMPSARRYCRNGGVRGTSRALGDMVRYLRDVSCAYIMGVRRTLDATSDMSNSRYEIW